MRRELERALAESFEAHERYREQQRKAREAHQDAKAADEVVRSLKRRERAKRSGRAA